MIQTQFHQLIIEKLRTNMRETERERERDTTERTIEIGGDGERETPPQGTCSSMCFKDFYL